jgi:hypothetical protein
MVSIERMVARFFAGAALVIIAIASCETRRPVGNERACGGTEPKSCPPGEICFANACRTSCGESGVCPAGRFCFAQVYGCGCRDHGIVDERFVCLSEAELLNAWTTLGEGYFFAGSEWRPVVGDPPSPFQDALKTPAKARSRSGGRCVWDLDCPPGQSCTCDAERGGRCTSSTNRRVESRAECRVPSSKAAP